MVSEDLAAITTGVVEVWGDSQFSSIEAGVLKSYSQLVVLTRAIEDFRARVEPELLRQLNEANTAISKFAETHKISVRGGDAAEK